MSAIPEILGAPSQVKPWRLLLTLGLGGAVAGFLIVFVFGATRPTIEANKARALDAAIQEVLKAPARYDTLYVVNGAVVKEPPAGANTRTLQRVYVGYAQDGKRVGFAIPAGEPGFQDVIGIIFGWDPTTHRLLGMKVLETKETPGLGDKIEKEPFRAQFDGAQAPLVGVKATDGKDRHHVQTITGATISSRTVIRAINKAVERLSPALERYREGER
ncbi:MAG: RnfABCDGE type electron transport complex subunit G [Candidatus Rokubacteria bacterium]|nr:RnfABCDGE type electron transport complex subunit G [Candidatus Rokubacteria bacterium]